MTAALRQNPFFVLGLPVTAGPRDVEREATKLLGMLELGLAAAATYQTPMGPMARTAEDVRAAAAALREPRKRLVAELWASVDGAAVDAAPPAGEPAPAIAGWPEAMTAAGWGRRR